jgi:tRNA uridine 5-carboxymethylaminomethyl modification enzyme
MLTARAEYRLRLRADNAAARLTPKAIAIGAVSVERQRHFEQRQSARSKIERLLEKSASALELRAGGARVKDDGITRPLAEWLRFPELGREELCRIVPELSECSTLQLDEAVQDYRYAPYVARQESEIVRLRSDEAVRLPGDLDYASIAGLSNEMVERLSAARPSTLGAASRIRGITPAALAAILVQARRRAA